MADLIDTSIFIAWEREGRPPDIVAEHAAEPVAIASITASELLAGVHRADSPARRARREAFVETILSTVPVIPFDLIVARTHARIWTELMTQGQTIGAHDLLIAATALAHGYAVLTMNVRDFNRVPDLTVQRHSW